MIVVFVITVIFQVGFKFYFLKNLEDKGYVACPGTPKSWVPGMAIKYVKDPLLCHH
ncbi:hypothetical protein ACFFJN_07120 [Erwinia mallotivora]|uniref:hypothetical protein n=1 Tax=Erwinia mallotivora TaxID=69222 RepID=UPI0035E49789